MRTKFFLPLSILCLMTSSSLCGDVLYAEGNDPEFYFVGDQKVILQRSSHLRALNVKGSSEAEVAGVMRQMAESGSAEPRSFESIPSKQTLLDRYGILLIEKKENKSENVGSFFDFIPSSAHQKGIPDSPVYSVENIEQILVNEFIVRFTKQVTTEAQVKAVLHPYQGRIIRKEVTDRNTYIVAFDVPNALAPDPLKALAMSNKLHQDKKHVSFSEPNFLRLYPKRPHSAQQQGSTGTKTTAPTITSISIVKPNDPLYSKQWSLSITGADIAWQHTKGSEKVTIAILDEGVDTSHPDLAQKIVSPYDATDNDNNQDPEKGDNHGTACAGIAAAATDNKTGISGASWYAKIMPVRIATGAQEGGWITSNEIIARGIRKAVERKASILSNSWGGGTASNLINSAIDDAIKQRRIVVFAAGNDSGSVSYPANLSSTKPIIAVSATNEWDEFKTQNSKDGENWWGSNFGPEVSLAAPGVHMATTDNTNAIEGDGTYLDNFNGTSSSTPLVAGIAALLLSKYPNLSPADIRKHLQDTADDKGVPGFDYQFGYGRVNAAKALTTEPVTTMSKMQRK
nr:S8 family serine peptidase [Nitrosomonas nitrosa]